MSRLAADASVFAAIADPTRRAVLELLREGELPVKALLQAIGATKSALSQHLAVLRRAGLVEVRREGRLRLYSIRPEPLEEVVDWIGVFSQFWDEKLENLGRYLDREPSPGADGAPSGKSLGMRRRGDTR
jgi:DNA-binding transcriptional ArsR family regulator